MIRFIKYQHKELITICIALVGCLLIWKLPTLLSWAKANNSLVVTIMAISIITAITALLIWIGYRSFHFFIRPSIGLHKPFKMKQIKLALLILLRM